MVSKDKDKDKTVRVGVGLLRQLSSTFYINTRMVFDELISNARDAFATEVRITIDAEKIVVEDNGEGMDSGQLMRFFYISYTDKRTGEEITKGEIKRHVIGKFGVGKLSIYQVCEWFEIDSWKRGIKANAIFNFKEIEEKKYLDEVELDVSSSHSKERVSGTRLTMHGLKKKIRADLIEKGLSKTMPLDSSFSVYINGKKLLPERREHGKVYHIHEKNVIVPLEKEDEKGKKTIEKIPLGDIDGELLYTTGTIRDQSGVYVRVFGRLVNENPRVIDLTKLTSGQQFYQRTHFEVNVNSLNEALLTSRAGFIHDHPKYEAFLAWAFTTLNRYNREEHRRYKKESIEKERAKVLGEITPRLKLRLNDTFTEKKKFTHAISGLKPIERSLPKGYGGEEHASFELMGERVVVEIGELGINADECVIGNWSRGVRVILNASHPLFLEAKEGKFLDYHCFKAVIMVIACNFATTLPEVIRLYNQLAADKLATKLVGLAGG